MCREGEDSDGFDDDEPKETIPRTETQRSAPLNETLVAQLDQSRKGDNDDLKILIATDIHVGYGENKPNRYLDSINTLEEVLQIAVEKQVDMILLGGDLFHENNPSRDMQHRVVQLLRQYCLNDKEVALEFMSDPSVNFNQSRFDRVNYEDGNLNVGLPVFTIHGNHDDMAGKGLTALDLLHEAGLVNLFGKHEDVDQFEVSPILLRKGDTRLALFGIGSQRDDRLCRAFDNESIKFYRPQAGADDWFNLFVLHQNRPKRANTRTTGAYLPERFIPSFFDLVVWGHEHECKKDCEYVTSPDAIGDGFYVLQPGSTIATSLTHEEALQKHVFMVKVRGRKFQCKPIPLQTTRQIMCDEIVLDTVPPKHRLPVNGVRDKHFVVDEMIVRQRIEELIARAARERTARQPELPLIRLKVVYAGPWAHMQPFNVRRIGAKYDDQVANALEMITTKKVTERKKGKSGGKDVGRHHANEPVAPVSAANIDQFISGYFDEQPWQDRLTVLTHETIGSAVESYAEDDVTVAKANVEFRECIQARVNEVKKKLKEMPVPPLTKDETGQFRLDLFEATVKADIQNMKRLIYGPDDGEEDFEAMDTSASRAVLSQRN